MVVVRPCWRKSRGRIGVDSYPEDQPPSKTSSFSAGYIQTYTNHSPVPRNKFFLLVKYGGATNQENCQGGTSRINLSILVKVHSLPGLWRCKIIWSLFDQLLPGTTCSFPKKKSPFTISEGHQILDISSNIQAIGPVADYFWPTVFHCYFFLTFGEIISEILHFYVRSSLLNLKYLRHLQQTVVKLLRDSAGFSREW